MTGLATSCPLVAAPIDRYGRTATRLSSGCVLVVGGYGIDFLKSVLLYDPNGKEPVPGRPHDPRLILAGVRVVLLAGSGAALSTPAVPQQLRRRRSNVEESESRCVAGHKVTASSQAQEIRGHRLRTFLSLPARQRFEDEVSVDSWAVPVRRTVAG
jgi:hypothetical protein